VVGGLPDEIRVEGMHGVKRHENPRVSEVVIKASHPGYRVMEQAGDIFVFLPQGVHNTIKGNTSGTTIQAHDISGGVNMRDLRSVQVQVPTVIIWLPQGANVPVLPTAS